MKILFVCKHNRFRSKVAEAFFNKLNTNQDWKAESAGEVFNDKETPENVIKVLKEFKVEVNHKKPRQINQNLIEKFDLIIVVADNVDLSDKVNGKKLVVWKISDTPEEDVKGILKRVEKIEHKVKELLRNL